jgi:hypothetical protein
MFIYGLIVVLFKFYALSMLKNQCFQCVFFLLHLLPFLIGLGLLNVLLGLKKKNNGFASHLISNWIDFKDHVFSHYDALDLYCD